MIRSIYLVARRDYLGYVTSWGFWLGMMLTPVLMGLGAMAPGMLENSQPVRYYTVIESGEEIANGIAQQFQQEQVKAAATSLAMQAAATGVDANAVMAKFNAALSAGKSVDEATKASGLSDGIKIPLPDFYQVDPPARTSEAVAEFMLDGKTVSGPDGDRPLFAAIIVSEDGKSIEYWSKEPNDAGLKSKLRSTTLALARQSTFEEAGVDITLLQQAEAARPAILDKVPRTAQEGGSGDKSFTDAAPIIVTSFIAFFLWILIFSVVNYLLMGTIEERSNKIFDTLLTSVKLPHLLAGKLLAVLAVSLTLMTFWVVGGTIFTTYVAQSLPADMVGDLLSVASEAIKPQIIVPALISFLLGYLMYGSLFLAIGSLCDTVQEAQTLMTPLIVLLMAPLFIAAMALSNPGSPMLEAMSWVPLFTPFLLILRMPQDPPMWEVAAQLGLMLLATVLILWLATRIYRAGAVGGAGMGDLGRVFRGLLPGGEKVG